MGAFGCVQARSGAFGCVRVRLGDDAVDDVDDADADADAGAGAGAGRHHVYPAKNETTHCKPCRLLEIAYQLS